MLSNDDRRAIEGLFSRLRDIEHRTEPRDTEAEALIHEEISRQPGAPYYMAQTVLVQEHALQVAERRIRELEDQLERAGRGDIFGGLFGGGRQVEQRRSYEEDRGRGPWDRDVRQDRGGGFLAGAAQTALGVTGGLLLGSAIAGMFGGGATAAEAAPEPAPGADAEPDAGGDDFDPGGFDSGGDGGFDFGGDF